MGLVDLARSFHALAPLCFLLQSTLEAFGPPLQCLCHCQSMCQTVGLYHVDVDVDRRTSNVDLFFVFVFFLKKKKIEKKKN
jgi:hypothetical protein